MERPEESNLLINWIRNRIVNKGLGCNIIVVGMPGSAKSYNCMRIAELSYQSIHGEKLKNLDFVVDSARDVFRFVRKVERPGEPLVIEELSVLAGSRRSMSKQNVAIMQLLDIVRKKQIILMMNAPTIQGVDKHVKRMSHIMLECLRLNKSKQFSTLKPLTLQMSQHTPKIYTHRLKIKGRDVHRCVLYKPSNHICKMYEVKKDEFQRGVYEQHELDAIIVERKKKQEGGIRDKMATLVPLTDIQTKTYGLMSQLGDINKVAELRGKDPSTIRKTLKAIERKLKPVDILGN